MLICLANNLKLSFALGLCIYIKIMEVAIWYLVILLHIDLATNNDFGVIQYTNTFDYLIYGNG